MAGGVGESFAGGRGGEAVGEDDGIEEGVVDDEAEIGTEFAGEVEFEALVADFADGEDGGEVVAVGSEVGIEAEDVGLGDAEVGGVEEDPALTEFGLEADFELAAAFGVMGPVGERGLGEGGARLKALLKLVKAERLERRR